jgi:hypothetical protein
MRKNERKERKERILTSAYLSGKSKNESSPSAIAFSVSPPVAFALSRSIPSSWCSSAIALSSISFPMPIAIPPVSFPLPLPSTVSSVPLPLPWVVLHAPVFHALATVSFPLRCTCFMSRGRLSTFKINEMNKCGGKKEERAVEGRTKELRGKGEA